MALDDLDSNVIENESTMDVTDKKCPNCGATVVYDPETLGMTCEFCGFHRELPKPEEGKAIEELDFETAQIRNGCDWGAVKKSVICQNCGGEAVYDAVDTASCCPFCGSTSVMPVEGKENVMSPGGVVPFEITRDKAAEVFKKWLKGRLFTPSEAKKNCKPTDLKGIYLPFWTYDTETSSAYSAQLGYEYHSDNQVKVRWMNYRGVYDEFIDDQVVYASNKTKNQYIQPVAVYDFSKLRPYTPEIVAGFAAERYSLGLDDGWIKAKTFIQEKLKTNLGRKLKREYNADRIGDIRLSTNYSKVTFKYLLAPIWISSFKYHDKVYSFVVNGQTGKVAGKAPISPIRVAIAIAIFIAIVVLFMYFNN